MCYEFSDQLKFLPSLSFRTWWRVTWCMLSGRRWRCWKNTSKSCMRGTLCWSGKTPCSSRWPARSSSGSCPNSSPRAATAHRHSSFSSSSTRLSPTTWTIATPPCLTLRGRVSDTSPTSHQCEPVRNEHASTFRDEGGHSCQPSQQAFSTVLFTSVTAKGTALRS